MAIFDSTKKHFLTFYCQLKDPVAIDTSVSPVPTGFPSGAETTVAALQAAFPHGMNTAPALAAELLNAPFRGYSDPGIAPSVWAPWSSYGDDGGPYPLTSSKFQRHTGGFLGIGGTTVTYYWMGEFILAPVDGDSDEGDGAVDASGDAIDPGDIADYSTRYFIEGFETPSLGPSTADLGATLSICPDASRHVGGLGLAFRGNSNSSCDFSVSGLGLTKIWQRMYLRLRRAPSSAVVDFWRNTTSPSAGIGFICCLMPNRTLAIYSSDAVNVRTLRTLTTEALLEEWDGDPANANAWAKIDILLEVSGTPRLRVYKNGTLFATATGASTATSIAQIRVGQAQTLANDMYLDYDDCVLAAIPERPVGTENLNGIDFLQGTKIVRVAPKAFSSNHDAANWTANFRPLLQRGISAFGNTTITSSTSGSLLAVDTDSDLAIDADGQAVGVVSVQVHCYSQSGPSGADGQLGAKLGAAAADMAVIAETNVIGKFTRVITNAPTSAASGQAPTLTDLTPIELRYQKAANAEAATVGSLQATAELVGVFGPEDQQAGLGSSAPTFNAQSVGCHNFPYKYSPWSRLGAAAPIAPYIVKSGTYVGDGVGRDLTFRSPVNWFFVRPVTGNLGGSIWWSSMIGNHRSFQEGLEYSIVDASEDPDFVASTGEDAQQQQYRVRIIGSHTQLNSVGVTYQYVAISDPGMRYMLNGVMSNNQNLASFDYRLVNDNFLADWAFYHVGDDSGVTTRRLYGQGSQSAADTIVGFDSSVGSLASAVTRQTGILTTKAALHGAGGAQGAYTPFSLFRRQDGNNDTGEAKVVNIGSYTGDGSASRTINLTPTTGCRPLFAMFFAEGSTANRAYWRDPSHTGSNSSLYSGTENTTGITSGGIDQISVGSSLNANGVVYNYFVLFADATAGNNGWGTNAEYVPVEPTAPADGPWPDDPPDSVLSDYVPPVAALVGEPDLDQDTVLSDSGTMIWGQIGGSPCETYSRALANRALKRLGHSRRISDLVTDTSEEAYNVRDDIRETFNEVLRDFPWPFATEYSALVLVDGSEDDPVNQDWTYSYRAPSQMIMARRIVPTDGSKRASDLDPITFRIGADSTGILIFTNEAIPDDGELMLEWTKRINCPAFFGDPLFREACEWKLAAKMAMPLAKDVKKEDFCLQMYQRCLRNASVPAANESQQDPDGDAPWITGRD